MQYAKINDERVKATRELDRSENYLCPIINCENPQMRLKFGSLVSPHFAHISLGECVSTEPETNAHIAMKNIMQNFLGLEDRFVEYIGVKGVKPDLLWGKFAIEVQHSAIQIEEIIRRNEIYLSNGLIPLWILHGDALDEMFDPGNFNKIHRDTDNIALKAAERYLKYAQEMIIYIYFFDKSDSENDMELINNLQFEENDHYLASLSLSLFERSFFKKTVFIESILNIHTKEEFVKISALIENFYTKRELLNIDQFNAIEDEEVGYAVSYWEDNTILHHEFNNFIKNQNKLRIQSIAEFLQTDNPSIISHFPNPNTDPINTYLMEQYKEFKIEFPHEVASKNVTDKNISKEKCYYCKEVIYLYYHYVPKGIMKINLHPYYAGSYDVAHDNCIDENKRKELEEKKKREVDDYNRELKDKGQSLLSDFFKVISSR